MWKFIIFIPVSDRKVDWSMLNQNLLCQLYLLLSATSGLHVKLESQLLSEKSKQLG